MANDGVENKKYDDNIIVDGTEQFWLGPQDPEKEFVYSCYSDMTKARWLESCTGVILEKFGKTYLRIYDPRIKSLSWIYRTIALIPISKVRTIYKLLGKFINMVDNGEDRYYTNDNADMEKKADM